METADAKLQHLAGGFATDIADLLSKTVANSAPIRPKTAGSRVVVAAYNHEGDRTAIALPVDGSPRFDLRLTYKCTLDSAGIHLAIDDSEFAIALHDQGEPIVRIHYRREREWAAAHIHVHAESSALAYGLAGRGLTKPPKTQLLHVPAGGPRFRPCMEDLIEFLVYELGVDAKPGWDERVAEGRQRWQRMQLAAALRDAIREDPEGAPERLKKDIDEIAEAVRGQ